MQGKRESLLELKPKGAEGMKCFQNAFKFHPRHSFLRTLLSFRYTSGSGRLVRPNPPMLVGEASSLQWHVGWPSARLKHGAEIELMEKHAVVC